VATADLGTTYAPQCNPATLGITSAAASDGGLLFLAGGDDGFYALDPATLTTVWRVSLGNNSAAGGYYGWCSPAIVGGVVLQGVSSNCDNPFVPGRLVALDESSGRIVAAADLTPPGVLGSGVWTSPAVDLTARKIFVSTASATNIDDGYAYSVLRIDLDTLTVEDAWRLDDPDAVEFDYDWGSSPTLFTTAAGRNLFGAGQKDGKYYAFDRANIQAGPVWTTPICGGGSTPQAGQGTLSTAAFDGTRLYMGGGAPVGSTDPDVQGTLTALDPSDGHVIWQQTFAGTDIAPVSFANGVVFSTAGQLAFGLDAATGRILWSFRTAGTCFGGIAISRGRILFGDLTGALYCFSIPQ
jgi:outer membrane protein assembly factor BamB